MSALEILLAPFLVLRPVVRRAGMCGGGGLVVGTITGVFLWLRWLQHGTAPIGDLQEALIVALILAVFSWLTVCFLLVALGRYRLGSVVRPTLINALIVSLATVLLAYLLGRYELVPLIGIATGFAIGAALCALYRSRSTP